MYVLLEYFTCCIDLRFDVDGVNIYVCVMCTAGKDSEVKQLISAFKSYYLSSEIYYVYHAIQRFTVSTICTGNTQARTIALHSSYRISHSLKNIQRHCLTWHYSSLIWRIRYPKNLEEFLKCILFTRDILVKTIV